MRGFVECCWSGRKADVHTVLQRAQVLLPGVRISYQAAPEPALPYLPAEHTGVHPQLLLRILCWPLNWIVYRLSEACATLICRMSGSRTLMLCIAL